MWQTLRETFNAIKFMDTLLSIIIILIKYFTPKFKRNFSLGFKFNGIIIIIFKLTIYIYIYRTGKKKKAPTYSGLDFSLGGKIEM